MDLESVTLGEVEEIKRLVTAYRADLSTLESPQEIYAYAEGVLEAARVAARLGRETGE